MTPAQRSAVGNGIWLCQSHAREIDADADRYSEELLASWKQLAERRASKLRGMAQPEHALAAAPLHLPVIANVHGRALLHFASRSAPFIGRDAEWANLEAFLTRDESFLWTTVSGPAGAGKSRLLLEFATAHRPEWLGGFIDLMRPPFDWGAWLPSDRTLVIIDYASTFPDKVRFLMDALERLARRQNVKIRLVLIDRLDAEALERAVLPRDAVRFLGSRDAVPLQLQVLPPHHLNDIARSILSGQGADIDEIHDSLSHDSRYPLFALILACLRSDGTTLATGARTSLVRRWLDRERSSAWVTHGVTKSEVRLACLASMSGPISADHALSGALATCGIDANEVAMHRYEALTGSASIDYFEPYTPDIVGEYLLLETLQDQNPSNILSKELLQQAWNLSPENMSAFLRRVTEDFAEHPVAMRIASFVPHDEAATSSDDSLGHPTLPTLWVETVPFLPVVELYHNHADAAIDLILTACETEIGHAHMDQLRRELGDQMFDDVAALDGHLIYSPVRPGQVVFDDVRYLAVRLSDIRWRLAYLIDGLLRSLTGFDEGLIDKILRATSSLLRAGQGDRRVRRLLFPGMMEGTIDRFGVADVRRARMLWDEMVATMSWWLQNPAKRAASTMAFGPAFGGSETDRPQDSASNRRPGPDASQGADEPGAAYSAMQMDGGLGDAKFLDTFGKAASNYVQFELDNASGQRDESAVDRARSAFDLLVETCVEIEGEQEMLRRALEAAAYLVRFHTAAGDHQTSDRFYDEARRLLLALGSDETGLATVCALRVLGHLARGDLAAAGKAFDRDSERMGLPDKVLADDASSIVSAVVNLASQYGSRGNHAKMQAFATLLDRIASSENGDLAATRLAQIALCHNTIVLANRRGADAALTGAVIRLEAFSEAVGGSEEARSLLFGCDSALFSQAFPDPLVESVERVLSNVFGWADGAKDKEVFAELLTFSRKFVRALAPSHPDAAQRIARRASQFALLHFADGARFEELIRDDLGGIS